MIIYNNLYNNFEKAIILNDLWSNEKCIKSLLKKNQVYSCKELFKINANKLKKIIHECYCKHVSAKENKDLYEEISSLLGMYVYVKDKINIKSYIIIGKNI